MESFSYFLEIPEVFQSHQKGTFLDIFWSKGYHLKDKNLDNKTSADQNLKHHLFCWKISLKKALPHIYGVRSIYNIMNVVDKVKWITKLFNYMLLKIVFNWCHYMHYWNFLMIMAQYFCYDHFARAENNKLLALI